MNSELRAMPVLLVLGLLPGAWSCDCGQLARNFDTNEVDHEAREKELRQQTEHHDFHMNILTRSLGEQVFALYHPWEECYMCRDGTCERPRTDVSDVESFQRHYRAVIRQQALSTSYEQLLPALDERARLSCLARHEGAPFDRALIGMLKPSEDRSVQYYAAEDALFRGVEQTRSLGIVEAFAKKREAIISRRARKALDHWASTIPVPANDGRVDLKPIEK